MENQRNEIHIDIDEEKNVQTIQQAIFDMHSQIGWKEEETDQENDER